MDSEPKNDYAEGYYWVQDKGWPWEIARYRKHAATGTCCWTRCGSPLYSSYFPDVVGERIERTEPTQATGGDAMMRMYVLVSKVNNGYQINVDGIDRYIAVTKEEALALAGKELGVVPESGYNTKVPEEAQTERFCQCGCGNTKVPDEGKPGRFFQPPFYGLR